MKKVLSLLLAAMMCTFLVACGSGSGTAGSGSAENDATVSEEAPPTDGTGITTNEKINETWDWISSIPREERDGVLTYEAIAERLGDDGEWIDSDTNADKGAIHYRWNDPQGGVIRLEFRPGESGSYIYAQGNTSGTN